MIRRATVDDARAIAEVQHRAWWRAYADIVDTQKLSEQDLDERERRWHMHLTAEWPAPTLVAVVAGRIAGFVTYGPSRIPEAAGDEGELMAIYVDPPAQGAGVGTALLRAAEDGMRATGYTCAVLDVFDANEHARAFYERHGWLHQVGGSENDRVRNPDGADAEPAEWAPIVYYRREL